MAYKAPTLMFVCDVCGVRKPLDKTKRHWCEECCRVPSEMRCTRERKPTPAISPAPLPVHGPG